MINEKLKAKILKHNFDNGNFEYFRVYGNLSIEVKAVKESNEIKIIKRTKRPSKANPSGVWIKKITTL